LGVQDEAQVSLWAGIVFSASSLTMAIVSPIWGALGDRYGRKIMLERAMFAGAVLIALMGFAQNVQQLALLRLFQGAFTGLVTAANALVGSTAPRHRVGYALGLLQMALYVGASGGPLLGGLVSDTLGYRATFWVTAALLLIAGLLVLVFVNEGFQPRPVGDDPSPGNGMPPTVRRRVSRHLAPVLGSTAILVVLGLYALARTGTRLTGPVLALFVESIAPPGARVASLTGLISGVSAAAGAVGALWLGRIGDRMGWRKTMIVCSLASVVFYAPQCFVPSAMWLLPLQALTGLAMGGILTALSASLAHLAPEGQEGIVYGASGTAMGIANVIGPMTGSALAAWLTLGTPFVFAAVVFGLAALAAALWLPER
jgi:DHA1 family multidrug resistance protein-like MFS transporter